MILTPGFNENDTEYSVLAVPYEKESVQITVTASGENAVLYIDGREAESGEPAEVPLEVGKQVIPIRLEDRAAGTESSASVSIYRKQSAASYKTEAWRDQYHFSPLEGWMNDPNGLIYYNDQWHLFYQYIPLTRAHSDYEKHWGHAVSDDLVHWEELPVALAPDELGSIWSGSTVNDPENKSGLFAGPGENNLLAFFTHMNSSGQVQSVAYSEDGGVTWEKYAGNPILTQEDDPLHDGAFRDPNVFWCEEAGKYLMVVAGGPVRIFSSDNLLDWEFESGYNGNSPFRPEGVGDIYSECPDLFPLAVDGDENNAKWVYTGAGRWYMIGDLKEIDGHWSFIPETGAISMTMAPDSYAGVTFKNADGGRVVMVSWMADWGTIQNAPTDGWNGTYTLCYDLSLRTTEDGIRLFQEPVKEYETLRGEPLIDETDIVIEENGGNILNGCRSDQFELVAHLEPEESVAEVGFRMFVGTGQEMVVKYNPQTSVLTMDRSRASAAASEYFGGSSSYTIHKNDDGSVDLRIDESNNAVARFEDSYTPEIGKKHHVELTWLEGRLTYVIDGHVIFDGVEDKNAGHVYSGGHVGVMGFNSTVVVNDVYAVPAAGLTGLQVSGAALSPAFDKAQTDYEAFVDCGTETVRVTPEAGSGVEITVSGEAVESGSASGEIALAPGENVITVTAASWNGEKTYTISVYRLPFEDVHQEDWFIDSIHYVYQRGIMIGHNEREFDSNMPMIRADTALVLYRVEGMPDVVFEDRFPDVKGGLWYSEAVVWASAEGIATGYSSGLFGTADPVTREQAVTMLFRYASRKGYAVDERTSLDRFADAGQVSGFAEEAMEWAVARGIISGKYDQTVLDPQGYASRAEYAAMIMRFMESYQ